MKSICLPRLVSIAASAILFASTSAAIAQSNASDDDKKFVEAALKGGQDGKVILPGDSAGSVLVHNVAHIGDEDDFMPPPDNKDKIPPLTKDQIGLIRAWIDQGAK